MLPNKRADLCSDYWSWGDSVYFYENALKIEKDEGFQGRVCHETHRNRSLFNPYVTDYVLQRVPKYVLSFIVICNRKSSSNGVYRLQITADISHWVVVCERLLDQGEEDQEILTRAIPNVGAPEI
jgi:hypothetical protein